MNEAEQKLMAQLEAAKLRKMAAEGERLVMLDNLVKEMAATEPVLMADDKSMRFTLDKKHNNVDRSNLHKAVSRHYPNYIVEVTDSRMAASLFGSSNDPLSIYVTLTPRA